MDTAALYQYLFALNDIEQEAFNNPNMAVIFPSTPLAWTIPEDIFLKPDQKIAFVKHPRFMRTPEHKHDFLEMNFVLAGCCVQTINGHQVTLQEGEICLLDTNVAHSIEPAAQNDMIINCLMRRNYFDSDLLRRLSGNDLISDFIINAVYKNKKYNQYILFRSGKNLKIKQLMNDILCEFLDPGLCSDEIINSYVMILFSELLRIYKKTDDSNKSFSVQKVIISDILLYLVQNYASVTLSSAAQHFGFHPNYLSRLLKNHIGLPFIKIVQDLKLNRACSILENTQIPVAKAAHDVGFSNMNSFYELFHNRFGLTPREYRLQKQKQSD